MDNNDSNRKRKNLIYDDPDTPDKKKPKLDNEYYTLDKVSNL